MGRKKGKKVDAEKKAALAARKEAKAEKAAQKRLQKESGDGSADVASFTGGAGDQLDSLLKQYQAVDKAGKTTTVETLDSFPLPRANATLTLYEDTKKKNAEIYLFGGEYFDGVENIFLNHLLKYDIGKKEWKQIHCPVAPPPRCAHSCVYYNHSLWVFGGELSRSEQFHHYKDLWRYDMKELIWEEIKPSKAVGSHPTPRSGHVAVVWKHFMVIFGGFYEANKETPRWYNEVYVMNLQTQQWLDIPYSKLSIRPEPRSACNFAVIGDDVVIHGGFSKLSKNTLQRQKADELEVQSETKVHTDAWILHLKPILSDKQPTWERLTSSAQRSALTASRSPNGRAAMASVLYKDRLLAFGGVVDTEALHHKLNSVFYNDMYAMDIERRKWFPVFVRQKDDNNNAPGRKKEPLAKKGSKSTVYDDSEGDLDEEEVDDSNAPESGWNLEKLRSNMFAFVDGNGNLVYERIGEGSDDELPQKASSSNQKKPSSSDEEEEEKEEEKEDKDDSDEEKDGDSRKGYHQMLSPDILSSAAHQGMTNSSVMKVNPDTKRPEAVKRIEPLPRINSCMAVSGNTLYLYGGLLEVGDREITLDDMWALDLKKRHAWECLWPGSMHKQVWRGAINDDDDSYYSTDNKTDKAGYDEDDESEEDEDGENSDGDGDGDVISRALSPALNADRNTEDDGLTKKERLKAQLAALRDKHDLANAERTPAPGEGLADFYERTSNYWNSQTGLSKESGASSKDIKREGFALAKNRFDDLAEVLEKFIAIELEYRKEKKAEKGKKDKKKEKR